MVTAVELRKEWMLKGNKRAMTEPGNDINKHRSQHARCWREKPRCAVTKNVVRMLAAAVGRELYVRGQSSL